MFTSELYFLKILSKLPGLSSIAYQEYVVISQKCLNNPGDIRIANSCRRVPAAFAGRRR
jgi:hypothetical protein